MEEKGAEPNPLEDEEGEGGPMRRRATVSGATVWTTGQTGENGGWGGDGKKGAMGGPTPKTSRAKIGRGPTPKMSQGGEKGRIGGGPAYGVGG